MTLKGGSPGALRTAGFRGAGRFPHHGVCSGPRSRGLSHQARSELFYPCGLTGTKKRVLFCFLSPLGAVFSKTSIRGGIYYERVSSESNSQTMQSRKEAGCGGMCAQTATPGPAVPAADADTRVPSRRGPECPCSHSFLINSSSLSARSAGWLSFVGPSSG